MTTPLQKSALAVIDKWTHSHPLKECAVLELREALDAEIAQAVEPVLYQRRMKPDCGPNWTKWDDCSEATFKQVLKVPNLHDWTYQSRALYLHPPQPQATTAVPDGYVLVPIEPTPAMWSAVNKLDDEVAANHDGRGCSIEQAWECLLSAAQGEKP